MEIVLALQNVTFTNITYAMNLRLKVLFFLFTLFSTTKIFGVDTIPSFYRLLHKAKKEIVQNPQQAALFIDSMKCLIKPGESNFALLTYELESEASFYRKDYLNAYRALIKIDSLLKIEGDQQRIAINFNRLGLLFTEWGAFDKALDYLTQALNIRVKLAQPAPIMFTLNAISNLYLEMGYDSLALKTTRQAIYYSAQVRDSFNVSHVYFSAGKIFEKIDNIDSAQHYYRRALLFRDAVRHYSGIVEVYNALARIALLKSNLDSSLFFIAKALEFAPHVDPSRFVESNLLLIETYQKLNQHHLALLTARKIQDKIEFIANTHAKKRAYGTLSELYENQGDLKNAIAFLKIEKQLQDSIVSQFKTETNAKISTLLKITQNTEQPPLSTHTTFSPKWKNRFFLFLLLIFSALGIFFYYKLIQTRASNLQLMQQLAKVNKENEIKNEETDLLKTQIEQQKASSLQLTQKFNQTYKSNAFVAKSIDEIMEALQKIIHKLLVENLTIEQRVVHYEKLYSLNLLARQRTGKILLSFDTITFNKLQYRDVPVEKINEVLESKISDILQLNYRLKANLLHQSFSQPGSVYTDLSLFNDLLDNLIELSVQNTTPGELQLGLKLVDDDCIVAFSDSRVLLTPEYQNLVVEWQALPTNDFPMSDFDRFNPWLYRACRISKHLGVHLQFEHQAESGVAFLLRIKMQNISKKKELPNIPNWNGKHILIAEDEILNYEVLKSYIKPTGAKVSHANTGVEIVEFIKTLKFDVVIMDIKMPRMDGLDALQILKRELPNIPVIACTAHANASERSGFIEMGFADLLLKPVCKEALYQSVGRFLQITR